MAQSEIFDYFNSIKNKPKLPTHFGNLAQNHSLMTVFFMIKTLK